MAVNDPKPLSREQLAKFLPDAESIKRFEKLFNMVGDLFPADIETLFRLYEEAAINAANADARAQQALDILESINQSLSLIASAPNLQANKTEDYIQLPVNQSGSLGQLNDAYISSPAQYNLISYDAAQLRWVNTSTINGAAIGNLVPNSGSFTTLAASGITSLSSELRLGATGTTETYRSNGGNSTPLFQLKTTSNSLAALSARYSANSATGSPSFILAKSRASNTAVLNNDTLGSVTFNGHDGTGFINAATIQAYVDGAPSTNDMPTRLVFSTTADGASAPTEAVRIDSLQRVGINTTPTAKLHIAAQSTSANTAPIKLNSGSLMTAAEAGAIEYDGNNLYFTCNALLRRNLVSATFVQTANKTITNTTAETSMFGTGVGTLTLPANFLITGRTLRIKGGGIYSAPAGGVTKTARVKYNGTTLATAVVTTTAGAETNVDFEFDVIITCRTTGVTGTVIIDGYLSYEVNTGMARSNLNNGGAAITINTTTSNTLDFTLQWDAATTTRTSTTTNFIVSILY